MKLSSLTRTRKGRVALAAVPTVLAVTALMGGVAQGAVPVSFAISGSSFKVAADKLDGTGFTQYGGVGLTADKDAVPLAISNISHAELTNLCQSVAVGPLVLLINAGGGSKPAVAENMQIGMTDLKGDATFTGMEIGKDASTVGYGPAGTKGDFSQQADTVKITNLQQTAYSTKASTFTLNGLHMSLSPSNKPCF